MATFAKNTFSFAHYAAYRPTYPQFLYKTVLAYHHGPRDLCVDLGCGHGVVTESLAPSFSKIIGTDPSTGAIDQAYSNLTSQKHLRNVEYRKSSAEDLPFLADGSVDMVVSAQAAHWFNYSLFFPEMACKIRRNGTLAFWGYKDPVFPDHPRATSLLQTYSYSDSHMGPYWQQPGRSIVQNKLRDVQPPEEDWEDLQRLEYEPGTHGSGSGEGILFLAKRMTLGGLMEYVRTFSALHAWAEKHPERKSREKGGEGDLVDDLFDEMRGVEPKWQGKDWKEVEVDMEWGSGLVMARRK